MRALRLICIYLGCVMLITGAFEGVLNMFHWSSFGMLFRNGLAKAIIGGLLALVAWKFLPQNSRPSSLEL
jgi:hypothetical protein